MATNTTKYGLRKPASSDNVNVTTDISDNMDKIERLALINRPPVAGTGGNPPVYAGTEPLLSWNAADDSFTVDATMVFNNPPKMFAARKTGTYDASRPYWEPVLKAQAPSNGNAITAVCLYGTGAHNLSGSISGLFLIYMRTPTDGNWDNVVMTFRWLCGVAGDNALSSATAANFALALEDKPNPEHDVNPEAPETIKEAIVYVKKAYQYQESVITVLNQWRNGASNSKKLNVIWQDVPSNANYPELQGEEGTGNLPVAKYVTSAVNAS